MDQQSATQTLSDIQDRQQQARRTARTPWWFYLATFLTVSVVCASNDFVTGGGASIIAVIVLVALVAVLGFRLKTGTAPLGRLRGVQARSATSSRRSTLVLVLGGLVGWSFAEFGIPFGARLADALHLSPYPYSVTGVLAGLVFTGVLLVAALVGRHPDGRPHRFGR